MSSERRLPHAAAAASHAHHCHIANANLPRLDALDMTADELLFLNLFRCMCSDLAHATTQGWRTALKLAESRHGAWKGLSLVRDVVGLASAIRVERDRQFSFMPADCPTCSQHVSEDEEATLKVLRAARRHDRTALFDGARSLTGMQDPKLVVLAATMLGVRMLALNAQKVH